jgi:hypothetical protein
MFFTLPNAHKQLKNHDIRKIDYLEMAAMSLMIFARFSSKQLKNDDV